MFNSGMSLSLRRQRPLRKMVRTTQPTSLRGASPVWVAKGLKSLYNLTQSDWQINQVSGASTGRVAGTGVTFNGGKLRTPGTNANGALLAHGLTVNIAAPVTFVVGVTHISGSVALSIVNSTLATWNGWFLNTVMGTAVNSAFSAGLVLDNSSVAFTHASSTSLRGSSRGGAVAVNSSATFPTVNSPDAVLGWCKRTLSDNPAIAEFTHFAAFQGSLSDADLMSLSANPWQLFAQ